MVPGLGLPYGVVYNMINTGIHTKTEVERGKWQMM